MIEAFKKHMLIGWANVRESVCRAWIGLIRIVIQNRLLLLMVGVVYVFQDKITDWIIALVCPLIAMVAKRIVAIYREILRNLTLCV